MPAGRAGRRTEDPRHRADGGGHRRAQGLFARVLDLPGGMRIGTIHAFCQSLLRRFPLEAALAPHFRLLEDADGHAELQAAREEAMAAADPAALATTAGLVIRCRLRQAGGGPAAPRRRLAPAAGAARPGPAAPLQRAAGRVGRRRRHRPARRRAARMRRCCRRSRRSRRMARPRSARRPSACSAGSTCRRICGPSTGTSGWACS